MALYSVEYDPLWDDGTILSSRIQSVTKIGELWEPGKKSSIFLRRFQARSQTKSLN